MNVTIGGIARTVEITSFDKLGDVKVCMLTTTADGSVGFQQLNQEVVDTIYASFPVDTAKGDIASFEDGADNVPVREMKINVEPYQNLNGYDSPWVGGAGVNLMPVPTVGLTISTASGTAGNVSGTPAESSTNGVADVLIPVDFTQYTYTYGWTASAYEYNPNVMVFGYGADKSFIERLGGTGTNPHSIGSGNAWTDYTLIKYVRLRIYNSTNAFTQTETNNANWMLVQGTELPTAWTPYENICPIFPATKNLIPKATDATQDAVTFTVADDGKITVSGTPSTSRTLAIATLTLKANHTYVLSGAPVGGGSGKWGLGLYNGSSWIASDWGNGAIVTPTADTEVTVRIRYWNNYELVSKVFAPQLENVTKSPYAPYQGISIARTGKNLVNQANVNGTSGSSEVPVYVPEGVYYWFQVTGNMSHNSYYRYSLDGITFKNIPTTDDGYAVATQSSDSYGRAKNKVTVHQSCWISCRLGLNANTGTYPIDVMLTTDDTGYTSLPTSGSTLAYSDFYTPYEGGAVSVTIGRDVYGGTLEVETGVLTVDKGYYELPSTLDWSSSSVLVGRYYIKNATLNIGAKKCGLLICNQAKGVQVSTTVLGECYLDTNGQFAVNTSYSTVADFKQSLVGNPITIAYELATPLVYQLTPVQVKTLLGYNNIWTDSGTVEVQYLANIGLYIQKIIGASEDDMVANQNISANKYFFVGETLYYSTSAISAGQTIVVGTNCIKTNLADALNALNS